MTQNCLWILAQEHTQRIQSQEMGLLSHGQYWLSTTQASIFSDSVFSSEKNWPYSALFFLEPSLSQETYLTWSNLLSGIKSVFKPKIVVLENNNPFFINSLQYFINDSIEMHVLCIDNFYDLNLFASVNHSCIIWHCLQPKHINDMMAMGVSALQITFHFNNQFEYNKIYENSKKKNIYVQKDNEFDLMCVIPSLSTEFHGNLDLVQDSVVYLPVNLTEKYWVKHLEIYSKFFSGKDSVALVIIPIDTPESLNLIDDFYQELEKWFLIKSENNQLLPEIILMDPSDFSGWNGIEHSGILLIDNSIDFDFSIKYSIDALSNSLILLSDNFKLNSHFDLIFQSYIFSQNDSNEFSQWGNSYESAKAYQPDSLSYYLWNLYVLEGLYP